MQNKVGAGKVQTTYGGGQGEEEVVGRLRFAVRGTLLDKWADQQGLGRTGGLCWCWEGLVPEEAAVVCHSLRCCLVVSGIRKVWWEEMMDRW